MKCDACQAILCRDHFAYDKHSCEKAYQKDNQVPVCPLCNQPVPSKRGQLPDIAVGEHIDKDCQDDRAGQARKKSDPNRCRRKGCKQRNLVPVLCSDCNLNFCLRHRHPPDHDCNPKEARIPKTVSSNTASKTERNNIGHRITNFLRQPTSATASNSSHIRGVQGNMSEDEALARALQESLNNTSPGAPIVPPSSQEDEDRMLAQAIAASQRETSSRPSGHKEKCSLS